MMLKPRSITWIFVLLLLSLAGASCDSPAEPVITTQSATARPTIQATPTVSPAPPTPTPTSAILVQAVELDQVQVSFWHPWTDDLNAAIDDLVTDFNRENEHGIQVSHESHHDRLTNELRASASQGGTPDLVAAYPHQINGWRAFGDLSVDIHIYSDDPNWGLDNFTVEQLVVPPGPGMPATGSAYYIFYNQSWAQELGFDNPPTTPDEFEDQACAAAAQRNDGLGGWVVNTHPTGLVSWVYAFGGQITSAQGEYRFQSPQLESAFVFLHGLVEQGCAWLSPETYPNQAFAERQALFYESSIAGIPFQVEAFEEADNQDEWIPIPYPAEAGEPVIVMYSYQLAVMRTAPEKQLAAWLFAKWLSEPEQQAALARTVERLPIRIDAVSLLEEDSTSAKWIAALSWLDNSQSEPTSASWEDVRWALSDAGNQMIAPGTAPLDVQAILAELQLVAEEIQALTP